MGTDISLFVEKFNHQTKKWEYLSPDGTIPYGSKKEAEEFDYNYYTFYHGGRNYRLFAVLAGVRNYADIEPIDDPRGIPEDSCKEIVKHVKYWDNDAHSKSYFTLKELLEFDWSKNVYQEIKLLLSDYKRYKKDGTFPLSSPHVNYAIFLSEKEADDLLNKNFDAIKDIIENDDKEIIVNTFIKDTYRSYIEDDSWFDMLNRLKEYSASGDGSDIRIVFFL